MPAYKTTIVRPICQGAKGTCGKIARFRVYNTENSLIGAYCAQCSTAKLSALGVVERAQAKRHEDYP